MARRIIPATVNSSELLSCKFKRRWSIRRPALALAAMAASCMPVTQLVGQTPNQQNANQQTPTTSVERLLNEREHRFSNVQLLEERAANAQWQSRPEPTPLRAEQQYRAVTPKVRGAADQLLGDSDRPQTTDDPSLNHARVLLNQSSQPQASWQPPKPQPVQKAVATQSVEGQFQTAQTSFNAPASAPRLEPNEGPGASVYQLRNVSMDRFEQSIVDIFGQRLRSATSPDGRYVRVQLPNHQQRNMTMLVDRQTGSISYEGDQLLKRDWAVLMDQVDRLPVRKTDGSIQTSKVLFQDQNANRTLQQVVYLMGVQEDTPPAALPGGQVGTQEDDKKQEGTQIQVPGLKNPVRIVEITPGQWVLVGDPADIATVEKELKRLAQETQENQPIPAGIDLKNVRGSQIEERVQEIYDASYDPIFGPVEITSVENPNRLIVVGSEKGVEAVRKLVAELDIASEDAPMEDFKTFKLVHISAADAERRLKIFFSQEGQTQNAAELPAAPAVIFSDYRSNQVTVRGAKQYILSAEQFLKTIDVDKTLEDDNGSAEVKIVRLRNALADEVAQVVQNAVTGQQPNTNQAFVLPGGTAGQGQQQQQQNNQQQVQDFQSQLKSNQLSLMTVGQDGEKINGGIMFGVRVTADRNSNSIIVTASRTAMPLVLELIEQLDQIPDAETQIKVFELVHGDAETLLGMLENLFGANNQNANQQNALSQLPLQGVAASDGQTLVNIRLSFEPRSNAIIASGPAGDLQVVEDLLNRLDARAFNHSKPFVYRLSNAPANDVADAINNYLGARNDIFANDPRTNASVPLANRGIIVQPEVVSNSLIVSALPEYRAEIEEIIRALDRRPPMVKVKTLIAEVDLDAIEEFGVELGIQDSLLFDRGTSIAANGALTGIGFPFNSNANAGAVPNANAFARELFAGQAVANLAVGRSNSDLGYSGFVLSAGNESLSVLLRALKDRQCVRVLSKPHITTVENLQGRVAIGASVPRVAGFSQNNISTIQDIVFEDVGVILEVTPRVSPDGMIILTVDAEKSSVGTPESGITIGVSQNGDPITAPPILKTEARTTLMARSGQTVVFSGLIDETKSHTERGVPIVSDLPLIGPLFKYESDSSSRRELMIIMTPYLVNDDQDIANLNQDEMERMHWCLTDVAEVYGNTDFGGMGGFESAVETVYPDQNPTGLVPNPQGAIESPVIQNSRLETLDQPRLSETTQESAEAAKTASGRTRRGLFGRRR